MINFLVISDDAGVRELSALLKPEFKNCTIQVTGTQIKSTSCIEAADKPFDAVIVDIRNTALLAAATETCASLKKHMPNTHIVHVTNMLDPSNRQGTVMHVVQSHGMHPQTDVATIHNPTFRQLFVKRIKESLGNTSQP